MALAILGNPPSADLRMDNSDPNSTQFQFSSEEERFYVWLYSWSVNASNFSHLTHDKFRDEVSSELARVGYVIFTNNNFNLHINGRSTKHYIECVIRKKEGEVFTIESSIKIMQL
jgi:hypothetical protein